jgi:HEAT repeat protein
VRSLSVITLLAFTALTVGDYQFKAIARAAFTEDDLARFFSLFYAGTGLVSFLFQILVTPRLLARLGVQAGMSVMPGLFGLASAGLLLGPRLVVATIAKFADNGFQYTIHETTLQALYVPFAARTKARTRAFLDAVVKPLSYGAGGLALVLLAPRVEVHLLSWLTVPLVALWLLAVPKARRLYLARLEKSLSSRGALALEAESQLDAAGRQLLLRALESDDGRRARLALEQLATEGQVELQVPLERLARHPDPSLRASALRHLAGLPGVAPAVTRGSLADPDPRVRVAAALAHAATAKDDAVSGLRELLEDGSASVRSAAAAALYRHAGLEGTLVASRHLQGLLDAGSPERRAEAAEVLGHLGEGAYRPLARLLSDPAMVVRRAALRAAGGVPDPRLLPTLLEALRDPATRQRAARALVAVGSPAVPALLALLEGAAPRPLRLEVPRLLRRIPCRAAYDGLRSSLGSPDSHLRLRVLAALSGLREELRRPAEPRRFVLDLVRAELVEALGNLAGWEAARPIYGSRLLAQEFEFRQSRAVRRVLRILELRFEREPLRLIKSYLGDPRRRPAALEVLDTLLDPPLRSLVMPFLDDLPAAERIRRAGALVPPVAEPGAFLLEQCRHPNPYVALLALDTLGRRKELTVRPAALLALEHDDPLVREGGVWALSAVDLEEAARRLPPLVSDPDPVVARCARWALERRPLDASQENVMLGTIEKVLFLMSAPIFEQLSAEDLAPLARVAEVEAFATGEALFSEGEVGDALYVVTQGRVAIERQGEAIAEVGAGECLGEMSVLDAEARSATARALEETEALRIGGEEFQELLHEQAEIASGVIQVLTKRLRETNARLAALRGDAGRST